MPRNPVLGLESGVELAQDLAEENEIPASGGGEIHRDPFALRPNFEHHAAVPVTALARKLARDVQRERVLVGPGDLERGVDPGRRQRARDPPGRRPQPRPDIEHMQGAAPGAELARSDQLPHRARALRDVTREREAEPRPERGARRRDGAPEPDRRERRVVSIRQGADERAERNGLFARRPPMGARDARERSAPFVVERPHQRRSWGVREAPAR